MTTIADDNHRQAYDDVIQQLADYVMAYEINSDAAYETARYCLMDTLGCGILALNFAACTKLLGPLVSDTVVKKGCRVPGTSYELDPVQAAFNIGTMIRWLDFNDTWLAAEWGHPSDNLGGILAICDFLNRRGQANFTMQDVLSAMIQAHEIQGGLALENSFNRVGLDHVVLVKVATAAVVMKLLGGDRTDVMNALSQALVDGQSLRTYRHAPNAGSRKSWAAGDATSRGVRLALMTQAGEMGYPSVLTAKTWGFYDVLFNGQAFEFQRPLSSYVMENILFKISFPAEFHAQTAVEAAVRLHAEVKPRLDDIEQIMLHTHESAIRIISKTGPLHNPADRDHCLQYMVAIGLLEGNLFAEHYEDDYAMNPMIDTLRQKMVVSEDIRYSRDYHDPDKRSIANALQVFFKDGSHTDKLEIEYPLGHRRRREEGIPVLIEKFERNLLSQYTPAQANKIMDTCRDHDSFCRLSVNQFMDLWIK